MATDLSALETELDQWTGREPATFWWRDDDLAAPTAQLDGLLSVSAGRPVAFAAVPFAVTAELANRLVDQSHVSIFQHGWKHQNHAEQGPNSEYPAGRPASIVRDEFSAGFAKLSDLFGTQFLPVFTPPWHGLDAEYYPLLLDAGFKGVSLKGRRRERLSHGLIQNNIHCVPISWSVPPSFGDPQRYIAQLVAHLEQRRLRSDKDEATGILTHHLVQTADSLEFLRELLDLIAHHPSARMLHPAELFDGGAAGLSSVERSIARSSPNGPSTTV
jgi:hypothetical protein